MKKVNKYIGFTNHKTTIFDEEVPPKFSASGHYCINISTVTGSNEKFVVQKMQHIFSVTSVR